MRWLRGELSWDVRSLLQRERFLAALPASTRARAVARAREALTSRAAAALLPSGMPGLLPTMAIAGLIGLGGALGGAEAFMLASRLSSSSVVAVASPAAPAGADDSGEAAGLPSDSAPVEIAPSERTAVRTEDGHEELRLLELARARLADEDFAAAMPPLAEHARRFGQGRLVEEREALRVEALSGLGRREEVRRAAAAFEARFPRSPLVGVVRRMASSGR
jgi:hypothetical protein